MSDEPGPSNIEQWAEIRTNCLKEAQKRIDQGSDGRDVLNYLTSAGIAEDKITKLRARNRRGRRHRS